MTKKGGMVIRMNDPYQVSTDPVWHHWVDGIIILFIGIAAGIVVAGSILMTETATTTSTTEIIRRSPAPQGESSLQTDLPSGVRIEEI